MQEAREVISLGSANLDRAARSADDLDDEIPGRLTRARRPPEVVPLGQHVRTTLDEESSLWCSPRMQEVQDTIRLIAGTDVTALISGETGTGKDVVARAIHQLSARHARP